MKILIRATNWVGDAILALPALRAVRGKFPNAYIAIVARPYVADIYREQSICDDLLPYDPKGQHRGWRGRELLAKELRAQKFDVALLLQNAFDAAWLAWRAGVPQRIGYARDGRSLLLTKFHSVLSQSAPVASILLIRRTRLPPLLCAGRWNARLPRRELTQRVAGLHRKLEA